VSSEELRGYLSTRLPDYMVPGYFMRLSNLPLTANGKLDRKALPVPEIIASDDYMPPSNDIEEKLVEIWADVLKIDRHVISIHKSFFDLGGHSLRATRMVSEIHKTLNVEVPLHEIFTKQNIERLADYIITVRQLKTNSEYHKERLGVTI